MQKIDSRGDSCENLPGFLEKYDIWSWEQDLQHSKQNLVETPGGSLKNKNAKRIWAVETASCVPDRNKDFIESSARRVASHSSKEYSYVLPISWNFYWSEMQKLWDN